MEVTSEQYQAVFGNLKYFLNRMKKLIDIPDQLVKPLKMMAVDEGLSFKAFIEKSLIELTLNKSLKNKKK